MSVKPIWKLEIREYLLAEPDQIIVFGMEEGQQTVFTYEEYGMYSAIMLGHLFGEYVNNLYARDEFETLYAQCKETLALLEKENAISLSDAERLAYYAQKREYYKRNSVKAKLELIGNMGVDKWSKLCRLYEGLYRVKYTDIF